MRFIITGFGPFSSIKENPSEKVAAEATEILKGMGIDCSFVQLTASIRSVDKFYADVNDPADLFVKVGIAADNTILITNKEINNSAREKPFIFLLISYALSTFYNQI